MLMKKVLSNFSRLSLGSSIQAASRSSITSSTTSSTSSLLLQNSSSKRNPLVDTSINAAVALSHQQVAKFSLFTSRFGLMEFFDDKKNWTEMVKIKHGRAWRVDELRLKSNVELHKLWYILLKERNMLLTMEEFYIQKERAMPSHERIAKVDESMENLLSVVEERNVAFNLLETGESKQLIPYRRFNSFGHIQLIRPREHLVPWFLNKQWKLKYHYKRLPLWSKFYRTLHRVQLRKERRKLERKVTACTKKVLEKFPEIAQDEQYVRGYYEKKFGFKPPKPFHEMIRKPRPDEVSPRLKEKLGNGKDEGKYYDEEF